MLCVLGDIVVVLLSMSGLRVKIFVHLDLAAATLSAVYLLRALSWSLGVLGRVVVMFLGLPMCSFLRNGGVCVYVVRLSWILLCKGLRHYLI